MDLESQVRRLEEELAESRREAARHALAAKRLEAVTANALDAIVMMDASGRATCWNKAAERMFGWRADEVLGRDVHGLLAPSESVGRYLEHAVRFRETGQGPALGRVLELEARRRDGGALSVELTVAAVDMDGEWHALAVVRDVTERRRMEDALRASERRLAMLVETAGEGIWQLDADLRTVHVNGKMAGLLGVAAEDMLGRSYFDFVFPEDLPLARAKMRERARGVNDRYELRLRRPDGTGLWFLVSATALMGEAGAFGGVFGMFIDITERRRAEEALRQEKAFSDALVNSVPGLLYLYSSDGRLFYWNSRTEEATGYGPGELADMRLEDWFRGLPDELAKAEDAWKLVRSQGAAELETRLVMKDGTSRPFYLTAVSLELEGESYLIGIGTDLTALEHTRSALAEREAEFRLIFENNTDAIVWADAETGLVVDCNIAAERLFERSRKELIGLPQARLHPTDRAGQYRAAFRDFVEQGSVDLPDAEVETASGRRIPVELSATVADTGKRRIAQGIFRDVTAQRQSRRELVRNLEEKELLLREVHHRVKNNLQLVTSLVNLQFEGFDAPGAAEMARNVSGRIRSMALVHEQLYRSGDLSGIDMASYVEILAGELTRDTRATTRPSSCAWRWSPRFWASTRPSPAGCC
ncbi:PAS domain S-box protein [Fundidesulfovibrio magnetotacticus]|uniref:PAS domain S-box protein n=1 Tax=Fundidesulfovibrio magnetotacticus TaxID=2730080 RepID=UPI001563E8F5|nr:PAS domain S-box protein [Fundidesulfovibrio magnetotacticus]